MAKICKKCGEEREFSEFHKSNRIKDGFKNECKICIKLYRENNIDKYKALEKKYRDNNKEIRNKKNKIYREIEENKIRISEQNRERYAKNVDRYKKTHKKYYQDNKDKVIKSHCNYLKNRKKIDSLFKLKCAIRVLVSNSIKKGGFNKKSKTEDILGFSFEEFKIYLESKFEDWMTWENYGKYNGELNYGWDLDHIIPLSKAKTEDDIYNLSHYMNLQPLCSRTNRDIKKDKIENPQ